MFGSRNFLFAITAAVDIGGKLFMWGRNQFGQLGQNNTTNFSSPVQVGTSTTWTKVSTSNQTLAVNSKGELWSWGYNDSGRLGLGDTINRSSPVQVGALTNWKTPTVASLTSMCLKTDDTLWSWGFNSYGSLGTGNTTNRSSPVQVLGGANWAVAKGNNVSGSIAILAVDKDSKLFTWGDNSYGQLGLGDTVNRSSPTQVGALINWKTPDIGRLSSVCVKTDGTLWTWGRNESGQLGQNNLTYLSSPVQVGALTSWAIPSVGYQFMLCTKTDGTLWSWGAGGSGKLGLNSNNIAYSSPKQIGALTNWAAPVAGRNFAMCSKTDGTIWAWGYGGYGQLGQNSTPNISSPVQVGSSSAWIDIGAGINTSGGITS